MQTNSSQLSFLSAAALALVLMAGTANAGEITLKGSETPVGAKSIVAPKSLVAPKAPREAASNEADTPRQIVVEQSSGQKPAPVQKIQLANTEEAPASAPKLLSEPKPLVNAASDDDASDSAGSAPAAPDSAESAPDASATAQPAPDADAAPAPQHAQPAHEDNPHSTYGYSYSQTVYHRPAYHSYGYSNGGGYDHCD